MKASLAVLMGFVVSLAGVLAQANTSDDLQIDSAANAGSSLPTEGRQVMTRYLKDLKTGSICVLSDEAGLSKKPPCTDDQIAFVDSLMENAVYSDVKVASNVPLGSIAAGLTMGFVGSVVCSKANSDYAMGTNGMKFATPGGKAYKEAAALKEGAEGSWLYVNVCKPADQKRAIAIYEINRLLPESLQINQPK